MNLQFETWYDKKINKINELKNELLNNPENYDLRIKIRSEEKDVFDTLVRIGETMEELEVKDTHSEVDWYE